MSVKYNTQLQYYLLLSIENHSDKIEKKYRIGIVNEDQIIGKWKLKNRRSFCVDKIVESPGDVIIEGWWVVGNIFLLRDSNVLSWVTHMRSVV